MLQSSTASNYRQNEDTLHVLDFTKQDTDENLVYLQNENVVSVASANESSSSTNISFEKASTSSSSKDAKKNDFQEKVLELLQHNSEIIDQQSSNDDVGFFCSMVAAKLRKLPSGLAGRVMSDILLLLRNAESDNTS